MLDQAKDVLAWYDDIKSRSDLVQRAEIASQRFYYFRYHFGADNGAHGALNIVSATLQVVSRRGLLAKRRSRNSCKYADRDLGRML